METTDAMLYLDPSQFTLEEPYDYLSTKDMEQPALSCSLSDVERLIDECNKLESSPTLPKQLYYTPEPWSPIGPPNRNCFNGPYDFKVEVNSSDVNKKKYLYSHRLHRIYVDMECNFSLHFNWRAPSPGPHTMLVRATVVFSDDAQAEKRVERCTQHYYQNTKLQANEDLQVVLKNVLHSSRELGSAGIEYCGTVAAEDSWFSVLVELTKTNEQSVAHAYKFVCKNSCPNGINRRAISIIFTLEDKDHRVYGRQMVGARVCACPRRDMYRDEKVEGGTSSTAGNKRLNTHRQQHNNKKIKTETVVAETSTSVTLDIVDPVAVATGIKMMVAMMKHNINQHTEQSTADAYNACIQCYNTLIQDIEAKNNL